MLKSGIESSDNKSWAAVVSETRGPMPLGTGDVLVPISPFQEYNEGGRLQAVIDLVSLWPKKSVFVLQTGALYRVAIEHMEHFDVNRDPFEQAKEIDLKWERENLSILESSHAPVTLYTWEYLLSQSAYQGFRSDLEERYITSKSLQKIFNGEVQAFIDRSHNKIKNTEEAKAAFLKYLKEECAMCVYLQSISKYSIMLYGGSISNAIGSTFDLYNLGVSIIRPRFEQNITDAPRPPVQRKYLMLNAGEEVKTTVRKIDEQALYLAERSEVLINCNVYLLTKGSRCVREEAAKLIASAIQNYSKVKGSILTFSDIKCTILIFSPEGKYDKMINSESWKKYKPSKKTCAKYTPLKEDELIQLFSSCQANGSINLKCLEKNKSKECNYIISRIYADCERDLTETPTLKEICKALEFVYTGWVYRGNSPEAKFFIAGEELYYSYIDGTSDKKKALENITDFLLGLTMTTASELGLSELETVGGEQAVCIIQPLRLAKSVFDVYRRQYATLSRQLSDNETATPVTSPRFSIDSLSRNSSFENLEYSTLDIFSINPTPESQKTSLKNKIDGANLPFYDYTVALSGYTEESNRDSVSDKTRTILNTAQSLYDVPTTNSNPKASTGLFFTTKCKLITAAATATTVFGTMAAAYIAQEGVVAKFKC